METQSYIKVRVIPRSSKNLIMRRAGDVVTVKLTAAPVEGAANKALISLLSEKLRLPKENIQVISGKSSRLKHIRVQGLLPDEIDSLLGL
jgi:uncharacterized protein (TIGR00251 family)